MVLFYKILKNDFLVVRSADYDDYNAGVDNLIINKKTGEVICAIDDFHEGAHDLKKTEKTRRITEKGGATMQFGLSIKNGKLTRSRLENLPVFYLGITSGEFEELVRSMSGNINDSFSNKELEIFSGFLNSLEDQQQAMLKYNLRPQTRSNVESLKNTLEHMKTLAQKSGQQNKTLNLAA